MKLLKILWFIFSFFIFTIPLSYAEERKINKYKDWEVSKLDNLIIYRTNGNIVHGHSFGWIKRVGQCSHDNLYLTYSSSHQDKDILEKLKNNKVPLKLVFPDADDISLNMKPPIISVNDLGSMKIITLTNVRQDILLNTYMEDLHLLEMIIQKPYASLFDITKESWSLDGYIAAKLKARELCESETSKRSAIVALGY